MGKKVRLFGFILVDASAVLLFVMALGLIFVGLYEMYLVYVYYNAYALIPPLETILMLLTMTLGLYILIQTLRHRGTTIH